MNAKVRVKEPSKFLYGCIGRFLSVLYCLKYKVILSNVGDIKFCSPFILLCNHASNIDFFPVMAAVHPVKLNFVMSNYFLRNKFLRFLAREAGCIPKSQFRPDPIAVRDIFYVVTHGGSVAIFPSGLSSYSGEKTYISDSIAKLIKKLNVPVLGLHISGTHIAYPKWNMKRLRKSKCVITTSLLFTKEELDKMKVEEIHREIVDVLDFDDYEWQRSNMIAEAFPRSVNGLERILFVCPNCMQEFSIVANHNILKCSNCGFSIAMNKYGFFEPEFCLNDIVIETPPQWHRWMQTRYTNLITDTFEYYEPADLCVISENGLRTVIACGVVLLTIKSITFTGLSEGKTVHLEMSNGTSSSLVCERGTEFEVWFDDHLYAIAPKDPRCVFKFVLIKEIIYKKYYLSGKIHNADSTFQECIPNSVHSNGKAVEC